MKNVALLIPSLAVVLFVLWSLLSVDRQAPMPVTSPALSPDAETSPAIQALARERSEEPRRSAVVPAEELAPHLWQLPFEFEESLQVRFGSSLGFSFRIVFLCPEGEYERTFQLLDANRSALRDRAQSVLDSRATLLEVYGTNPRQTSSRLLASFEREFRRTTCLFDDIIWERYEITGTENIAARIGAYRKVRVIHRLARDQLIRNDKLPTVYSLFHANTPGTSLMPRKYYLDPWGSSVDIVRGGHRDGFHVISFGPDLRRGTTDDVSSARDIAGLPPRIVQTNLHSTLPSRAKADDRELYAIDNLIRTVSIAAQRNRELGSFDRWGRRRWVHFIAATHFKVRSCGPDGQLFTPDDLSRGWLDLRDTSSTVPLISDGVKALDAVIMVNGKKVPGVTKHRLRRNPGPFLFDPTKMDAIKLLMDKMKAEELKRLRNDRQR